MRVWLVVRIKRNKISARAQQLTFILSSYTENLVLKYAEQRCAAVRVLCESNIICSTDDGN